MIKIILAIFASILVSVNGGGAPIGSDEGDTVCPSCPPLSSHSPICVGSKEGPKRTYSDGYCLWLKNECEKFNSGR